MSQYVVSLAEETARDLGVTGGKGASLARLTAADLPVPPGVCVTTAVYEALVDTPELRTAIEALEGLDPTAANEIADQSAAVRAMLRDRELPETAREELAAALEALDADAYAVRSSATAEDLPTASFAGQHETFLGVDELDVIDRVRDCLASLFTDRAVTYRLRNGVPHGEVAMAVVVQVMVDPEAAGVLFTADPVSGNRHVASIDANFGLGDTVVAGDVSPDNARVDRRSGEILEYAVGEKRRVRQAATTGGTETIEVATERRRERALSDAQLRTLVDLGDRVETLLDGPQDIEWALVDSEASADASSRAAELHSGAFVLLQSRPITSLFPLPEPRPTDDDLHVYLSFGHVQAMPAALPPLVVDFWREFMERSGTVLRADGARMQWMSHAGGRIYADMTPLLRLAPLRRILPGRLAAVNEPASDGLRDLLDRRPSAFPARSRLGEAVALGRALRRMAPVVTGVVPRVLRRTAEALVVGPADPERERAWVETWGQQKATRLRAPDTVAGRTRAVFERVDFSIVLTDLLARFGGLLLSSVVAKRLLDRLCPDAADDLDTVGKGFEYELVTQMNQRLGDLADVARAHPEVRAALREEASVADLDGVDGGDAFLHALDDYLDDFGHRASGEIDISRPRWRDDPATLLQTVRSNLADDAPGAHRDHLQRLEREAEAAANRLEVEAGRGLLGPVRQVLVRRLIATYRGGLQLREYPKQGIAHVFAAAHDVLADAGEELAANGRLARAEDVWFLHREELLDALETGDELTVDIAARRRRYDREVAMTPPPLVTSEGEALTGAAAVSGNVLTGTAVSSGVVEGVARVIRDPGGESLERGEILVAPATDPGWTPLFLNAAGLVMEVGGRMTHGALVAREYGIPAVAAVSGATTEIQTGERIRIDGSAGTIEFLDRA
ncbi:PEP/pyruvate-binding domain-containing protein [Halorarius litoreus]|uniref:PEP/pyruvate-binding domain-containing protein n=1 Tax=Halorarius litoreus TaxID=2962676 RepID=UPI0020CCDD74|nr:PEP/pyruvate-binding domain-containing protein [Halorarius litoreus]